MKKIIIASLLIVTFLSGCKNHNYLDANSYNKIINICPNLNNQQRDVVVYYFDGDCGLCLAKVIYLEKEYNNTDIGLIFIAKTLNPDILKYDLSEKKIKSCVYFEKDREFEKTLIFGNAIKVNTDRSYSTLDIK